MNKYFKLVHFEFNRFLHMYLILIGITIISQIIGVIVVAKNYVNNANKMIYEKGLTQTEFLNQYGAISFERIMNTLWFMGPIALCIVALLIYLFFIWYRDWFGKNTFIYRLLMLPTARMNLYYSKATAIFLMVLGLIALQIVLLLIETAIMQSIVPADLRNDLSVYEINKIGPLAILLPRTIMEFIIHYGAGLLAIFVLFTAILFERSFRWKGIILAIIYCIASVLIFILPLLVQSFILIEYFYPAELLGLEVLTGLLVMAGALFTAHYLLKNKITV